MTNAADEAQVKESAKRAERERRREVDDFRRLLAQPEGRRFVWRYLERCGVFRLSWHSGSSHGDVSFREGERNIGLMLLADIENANPHALITMMTEARANEERGTDVRKQ